MTTHEIRIITYPALPTAEITPLELLVLTNVLECSETEEGLVLFTDFGPVNPIRVERAALITAFEESRRNDRSALQAFLARRGLPIDGDGPGTMVEIDLSEFPWQFIAQDILSRSAQERELVVIQWMNHPSQRPESYGASVSLITGNSIFHATSDDLLARFREDDRRRLAGAPVTVEEAEAHALRVLQIAACIWEEMLDMRRDVQEGKPVPDNIHQMLAIWKEVGSTTMRRFACDLTSFALDVEAELPDLYNNRIDALDCAFVRALLETILWSADGPHREGEPEEFLEDMTAAVMRWRTTTGTNRAVFDEPPYH